MTSSRWWIAAVVATVLLAICPIFFGKFYISGDTRDVFIPLETFFHQEELKLHIPAWDPDVSWGFPVIASAQIGFFYPPLLLTRWLPVWFYLPLNLVAHLIAMGLGSYFFLKKLGRSDSAAYLGAISFTLSAFIFQHLTHLNIIFAIAWFPWQLSIIQRVTTAGAPHPLPGSSSDAHRMEVKLSAGPFALLAMALAIPFLAGQIQVPLLMAIVSSLYYLFLSPRKSKALVSLVGIAIVSICFAAAQLFPTAELAWHSTRGRDSDFDIGRANQYSWPLFHAPALLFPRFFGSDTTYWGHKLEVEQGFWIGTIPLLLALAALCKRREPSLRFWKWLTVISFLLALGSLSPFRLIGIEPSLWFFSAPARWLLFVTFGLSVLAAYGWDQVGHGERSRENFAGPVRAGQQNSARLKASTLAGPAAIVIIFLLAVNFALFLTPNSQFQNLFHKITQEEYYLTKLNSLLSSLRTSGVSLASPYTYFPLILLGAAPFLLKTQRGKTILLIGTTLELLVVSSFTNPTRSWQEVLTPPSNLNLLPQNILAKQARIFSLRDFEDQGELLTNPAPRTFDRIHLEPYRLLLPLIHAQFGVPGVIWPASLDITNQANTLSNLKEQAMIGNFEVAKELNIGTILSDPTGAIEVTSLSPKPRASLVFENGTEIAADYREISPGQIEIKTSAQKAGNLIVRDSFFPGWDAFIDGQNVPILQSGIFREVKIPPGTHTITMRYEPGPLWAGIGISVTSFTAATAFLLWSSVKFRRQSS